MKPFPKLITGTIMALICFVIVLIDAIGYCDVIVTSMDQLYQAIGNANDNPEADKNILIADGTYRMNRSELLIQADQLTIASQSHDRQKVIISGMKGMNSQEIEFIFQICADNVTIEDITLENTGSHAIMIMGQNPCNAKNTVLKNLIVRDTYEQMIKITGTDEFRPGIDFFSQNGLIENCLFYYTSDKGPQNYIGGIDAHTTLNWIVRNNIFLNIRSPETTNPDSPFYNPYPEVAEHAIHFWDWSKGTVSEGNLIINCDRGIGYGLADAGHYQGIIRNNMIYHANLGAYESEDMGDVGIGLEMASDVQVYNNTVYFENDYPNAIEFRFPETQNIMILNNLANRWIQNRDNAMDTDLSSNIEQAEADWFKSITPPVLSQIRYTSDIKDFLHIKDDTIADVIDQGINVDSSDTFYDFDGAQRPVGNGIDIGADEYGDDGSVPSPGTDDNGDNPSVPDTNDTNAVEPGSGTCFIMTVINGK